MDRYEEFVQVISGIVDGSVFMHWKDEDIPSSDDAIRMAADKLKLFVYSHANSGGRFVKVFTGSDKRHVRYPLAVFHGFGTGCIESHENFGNFSTAIIELQNGFVETVDAEQVQFLGPSPYAWEAARKAGI